MLIHTLYKPGDTIQFPYTFRHSPAGEYSGQIVSIHAQVYDDDNIYVAYTVFVNGEMVYIEEKNVISSTTGPNHIHITSPLLGMNKVEDTSIGSAKHLVDFGREGVVMRPALSWGTALGNRYDTKIVKMKGIPAGTDMSGEYTITGRSSSPRGEIGSTPSNKEQFYCYNQKCEWHSLGNVQQCLNSKAIALNNCTGRMKSVLKTTLGHKDFCECEECDPALAKEKKFENRPNVMRFKSFVAGENVQYWQPTATGSNCMDVRIGRVVSLNGDSYLIKGENGESHLISKITISSANDGHHCKLGPCASGKYECENLAKCRSCQ